MKFNKIVTGICLLVAIGFSAQAQFGYNRFANSDVAARKLEYLRKSRQRSTIGISFRLASADFSVHYNNNANNTPSLYRSLDTTITKSVSTGFSNSAGVFYDWFTPIAHIDDKSIVAMSLCFAMDFYTFKVGDANAVPGSTAVVDDVQGSHGGFMLGLEYKSGGDAVSNKAYKSMFSVGAGVMPSLWTVDYTPLHQDGSVSRFVMTPYIKAEAGFLLGIVFKVRADVMFGKANYLDATNISGNERLDVTMKGSMPGVRLSVGIMPFSWDWDRD